MKVTCLKFRSYTKGGLLGFCDFLYMTNEKDDVGLAITNCTFRMGNNGEKFIGLPSKKYENELGETKYSNYLYFTDKSGKFHHGFKDTFNKLAIRSIEEYCKEKQDSPEHRQYAQQEAEQNMQEDLPF